MCGLRRRFAWIQYNTSIAKRLITFGYTNTNAPRYINLTKDFEKEGYEIVECHTQRKGFFAKYSDLSQQFRSIAKRGDSILITFPGQYLTPLVWMLTLGKNMTVKMDAFVSLYDSLVTDRKKYHPLNPYAWLLYFIDFVSCHLVDEVLIDTAEHGKFFARKFLVPARKIKVYYLGAREDLFTPRTNLPQNKKCEVVFYGTYIPLQGIETIIKAANILEKSHPDIHFTLLGSGQTYEDMRSTAGHLDVSNITFTETIPLEQIPNFLKSGDIALGIFGTTPKAMRVIPHKVYDAIACNVPVITMRSPAILEKYQDVKEVHLCNPGDPEDLAKTIIRVKESL